MAKIVNTKGAAHILGVSVQRVHKIVEAGKLQAWFYDDKGDLVQRTEGKRQGASLFFYESDLNRYKRRQGLAPAKGRRYTDAEREQVIQLRKQGVSNRDIGKQLGISYQTVNNWINQAT